MSDIEMAYIQYAQDVHRHLFSLSNNEDLAEDLTQETFFRAMRTIHTYDGSCKLSVWLCQIARHIWYQWLDKHSSQKSAELKYDLPGNNSPEENEIDAYSRDINRNGENVKITYYCYTESLWRKLFYHNTNTEFHIWSSGDMYDFCQAEYVPQKREIYYLAVGNLSGLEHISDEEFDALKENAILVWSGIN